MAEKYPGLARYVLETDYGCYSEYGWTFAASRNSFKEGLDRNLGHLNAPVSPPDGAFAPSAPFLCPRVGPIYDQGLQGR
jgi:hypothetical protein